MPGRDYGHSEKVLIQAHCDALLLFNSSLLLILVLISDMRAVFELSPFALRFIRASTRLALQAYSSIPAIELLYYLKENNTMLLSDY